MSDPVPKFDEFYPEYEDVKIGETLLPTACLIEYRNTEFRVNMNTLENLSKISQKICVVGIGGPMKLGKSFFLNLIFKEKGGFGLGGSSKEGIYIWGKKAVVKGEELCMVLLDTGFSINNLHHDEEFVNKLQCLMVLLSGMFVYNTFSAIDYNSIKRLNFVSKMSHYIHIRNTDGSEADTEDDKPSYRPRSLSPLFIWILRDVFLKPVIEGIEEPTDDEYMDFELATYAEQKRYKKNDQEAIDDETDDPSVLANIAEIDHIKSKFRSFFPFRQCFRLIRPIIDEEKLQDVELNMGDVRPEFISKMKEVIAFVYKNFRVKKFTCNEEGCVVDCNGKIFAKFIIDCVKSVNKEEYIDLQPKDMRKAVSMMSKKKKKVLKDQMKMMKQMMSMLQKQMKIVSDILDDEDEDEEEKEEVEGED